VYTGFDSQQRFPHFFSSPFSKMALEYAQSSIELPRRVLSLKIKPSDRGADHAFLFRIGFQTEPSVSMAPIRRCYVQENDFPLPLSNIVSFSIARRKEKKVLILINVEICALLSFKQRRMVASYRLLGTTYRSVLDS
jgi:hypothetical protein